MIDRLHIEQWADMQSSKGDFPELILRLVISSVPPYLTKCDIPYGSAVYMSGWDGEVDATESTTYIPQGKSILEFGTNSNFKAKAKEDYDKRSIENIEGYDKKDITFIFMTPRVWGDKKDWEDEKKKESIWKDVRSMIPLCLLNGLSLFRLLKYGFCPGSASATIHYHKVINSYQIRLFFTQLRHGMVWSERIDVATEKQGDRCQ